MQALGSAFVYSAVLTGFFFALHLIRLSKRGRGSSDNALVSGVICSVISIIVSTVATWLILYFGLPAVTGPFGGFIFMVPAAILTAIIFAFGGDEDGDYRVSAAQVVGTVGIVLMLIVSGFMAWAPRNDSEAKQLAHLVNIKVQDASAIPPTDANHLPIVSMEAALYKAKQVMSSASDGNGRNLSTVYVLGKGTQQDVNGHYYWIFDLRFSGWRVANQVNRIIPGYVVVDAENPDAAPTVKLGFKMKYTFGAPTGNSLHRLIYGRYKNFYRDDPTLEVRDDWQPFYTLTLNKPALRFKHGIPVKTLIVDPETGKMEEMEIEKTPAWVDRVYSAATVKSYLTWWGVWNDAPYSLRQTATNRMKPSGEPTLVYTKGGHPSWQVLMTSMNSDTSVIAIVLFDGRSNTARLYKPKGAFAIESTVHNAFQSNAKNIGRAYESTHAAIHMIYGRPTWVTSFVTGSGDEDGAASFQAVGLMPADDVQGSAVVMQSTKAAALDEYRQVLARGSDNSAPGENSLSKTVKGTIIDFSTVVESGTTKFYIRLNSDKKHVFRVVVSNGLEVVFAEVGSKVRISYVETDFRSLVDVKSYDDLALSLN